MGEVIDFKKGLAAEVIPLFVGAPSPNEPVEPRAQFGLRSPPIRAAMELARDADKRRDAIAKAAKAAGDALRGAPRAFDADEVFALCNVLDLAAETARDLGKRAGRPAAFGLIANTLEETSERLVHLLAEIVGDER